MRWMIYLAALVCTLLVPVRRTDVAKLQPVEVISVERKGEIIMIRTDTEDMGTGNTLEKAVDDMKNTTPGILYLDTAEYLLIYPGCDPEAEKLKMHLKDNVRVCRISQNMDLAEAAAYLDVHRPPQCLKEWKTGEELDELKVEKDRFIFVKNTQKKQEKSVDKTKGA